MRKKVWMLGVSVFLIASLLLSGCSHIGGSQMEQNQKEAMQNGLAEESVVVTPSSGIDELESGFSAVRYDGDYGFDHFLSSGGASSDREVVEYLANNLLSGLDLGDLLGAFSDAAHFR